MTSPWPASGRAVPYQTTCMTKKRLARIIISYNKDDQPVTAGDLKAQGAMAALPGRPALALLQTLAGVPAFVPAAFANIAHGCNSVVAAHDLKIRLCDRGRFRR